MKWEVFLRESTKNAPKAPASSRNTWFHQSSTVARITSGYLHAHGLVIFLLDKSIWQGNGTWYVNELQQSASRKIDSWVAPERFQMINHRFNDWNSNQVEVWNVHLDIQSLARGRSASLPVWDMALLYSPVLSFSFFVTEKIKNDLPIEPWLKTWNSQTPILSVIFFFFSSLRWLPKKQTNNWNPFKRRVITVF